MSAQSAFKPDLRLCIYGALLRKLGAKGTLHVTSIVKQAIELTTNTAVPTLDELSPSAKSAILLILARSEGRLWQYRDGLVVGGMYLTLPTVGKEAFGGNPVKELQSRDLTPW